MMKSKVCFSDCERKEIEWENTQLISRLFNFYNMLPIVSTPKTQHEKRCQIEDETIRSFTISCQSSDHLNHPQNVILNNYLC